MGFRRPGVLSRARNTAIAAGEGAQAAGRFVAGIPGMVRDEAVTAATSYEDAGRLLEEGDRQGAVAPALRGAEGAINTGLAVTGAGDIARLGLAGLGMAGRAAAPGVARVEAHLEGKAVLACHQVAGGGNDLSVQPQLGEEEVAIVAEGTRHLEKKAFLTRV